MYKNITDESNDKRLGFPEHSIGSLYVQKATYSISWTLTPSERAGQGLQWEDTSPDWGLLRILPGLEGHRPYVCS